MDSRTLEVEAKKRSIKFRNCLLFVVLLITTAVQSITWRTVDWQVPLLSVGASLTSKISLSLNVVHHLQSFFPFSLIVFH